MEKVKLTVYDSNTKDGKFVLRVPQGDFYEKLKHFRPHELVSLLNTNSS